MKRFKIKIATTMLTNSGNVVFLANLFGIARDKSVVTLHCIKKYQK